MKSMAFCLIILGICISFAEPVKENRKPVTKAHREHKAHQHGAAELGIAFEGSQGALDFEAPAESVIGFEHKATNESDLKLQKDMIALFEQKMTEMIVFDPSLNCKFSKSNFQVVRESGTEGKPKSSHAKKHGEHSDFKARSFISCDRSPAGTELSIDMQKYFKKINNVKLQLIVDMFQKSITVEKNTSILLK